MNRLIDETEMKKKKLGTYSVMEILKAVNTFLNTDTDMLKKKHGNYSIVEILQAVKELNEQNKSS